MKENKISDKARIYFMLCYFANKIVISFPLSYFISIVIFQFLVLLFVNGRFLWGL
jgi:hypothetical protein